MMRPVILFLSLLFATALPAAQAQAATDRPADYCTPYILRAEKKYKIPRGLLLAIALVESGVNGRPWPWALNVGGQGIYPKSYAEAIGYLRRADGTTRPDVAVGCMQVFLRWHSEKFSAPEYLLYPEYNVAYAARYLRKLYEKHGNWSAATANYHARENKQAQYDYVCAVFKRMHQIRRTKPSGEGMAYCRLAPKK